MNETKFEEEKAFEKGALVLPALSYEKGQSIATRAVYGKALVNINNENIIGLDGDTKNSTFAETYALAYPNRFIECFIAE